MYPTQRAEVALVGPGRQRASDGAAGHKVGGLAGRRAATATTAAAPAAVAVLGGGLRNVPLARRRPHGLLQLLRPRVELAHPLLLRGGLQLLRLHDGPDGLRRPAQELLLLLRAAPYPGQDDRVVAAAAAAAVLQGGGRVHGQQAVLGAGGGAGARAAAEALTRDAATGAGAPIMNCVRADAVSSRRWVQPSLERRDADATVSYSGSLEPGGGQPLGKSDAPEDTPETGRELSGEAWRTRSAGDRILCGRWFVSGLCAVSPKYCCRRSSSLGTTSRCRYAPELWTSCTTCAYDLPPIVSPLTLTIRSPWQSPARCAGLLSLTSRTKMVSMGSSRATLWSRRSAPSIV